MSARICLARVAVLPAGESSASTCRQSSAVHSRSVSSGAGAAWADLACMILVFTEQIRRVG